VLIELLEELVANSRVVWLTGEEGHVRRPEGEPNTYRKALYVLEDVSPYRERLSELEAVQQEGQAYTGVQRPGLLLPLVVEGVQHVVLRKSVSWASHAFKKEVVVAKLEAYIERTKENLRVFELYATTHDPRREKVEREIKDLEAGLERLKVWDEPVLRERARTERHSARLIVPDPVTGRDRTELVYVRDVGLIVAGPGLSRNPRAVEVTPRRKKREGQMREKLEPIVVFGNFEVFSEKEWQAAKEEL